MKKTKYVYVFNQVVIHVQNMHQEVRNKLVDNRLSETSNDLNSFNKNEIVKSIAGSHNFETVSRNQLLEGVFHNLPLWANPTGVHILVCDETLACAHNNIRN